MWWPTLQALFSALRTGANAEARSLYRILCFYIISGYSLGAIQAAFHWDWIHSLIVGLGIAIIAVNAYNLFRINRLIRFTAVGELLEVSNIIPNTTGITSNDLIKMYWNIAVQLLIFMTGFCLLIPHLSLYREWWLALAWPTMFIFVAIVFGALGRWFLRLVSSVAILGVIAVVLSATFPQIDAQLHLGFLLERVLPNKIADGVSSIDTLRKKQRENQIATDLEEVKNWIATNPNAPYPKDYERFLYSVRNNGTQKTLSEIRKEIIQGVPPQKTSINEGPFRREFPISFPKTSLYPKKGTIVVWKCTADGNYDLSAAGTYLKQGSGRKSPDRVPVNGMPGSYRNWHKRYDMSKKYGAIIFMIDNREAYPGRQFIGAGEVVKIRFNLIDHPEEFYNYGKPRLMRNPKNPLTIFIES